MPSANITALTNAAAFLPDALFYMAASPFGVTDDRKITGSTLFTTIAPLNNNTAALIVTNSAAPTTPQVVFTNTGGTRRMQVSMAGAASITDTFDDVSIFSSIAAETLSLGIWNATDTGVGAELFLYTGAAGLAHLRIRATDGGAANGNFLDVPNSGVLFTSNASPGGLILCTDEATAPIIFAAGDNLFTAEKGRFDAAGFTLGKVSSITGALNLANAASAFLTTITAGNAAAARTYVWPTNFGSAGDVLTDAAGNGVLSWAAGGGGGGTAPQVRAFNNANQSINSVAGTFLNFDSERFDTDAMHFTSSANLTGTVTKTATSATLVGVGTAFLTELSVGQVIAVPGTATEQRVVTAIASDTSLTVAVAFANTAAAQVGVRINGALVARTAGTYQISASVEWELNGTNIRIMSVNLNPPTTAAFSGTAIVSTSCATTGGASTRQNVSTLWNMAQWDYVEVVVYQDSGGALNIVTQADNSPEFMMIKVSDS